MTVYPFFENIDNKTFLIAGGGEVARGKVERLLQFTSKIIVVAQTTSIRSVRVLRRTLTPENLDEILPMGDYVIAATDDPSLNEEIARCCQKHRIPVNVVDCPRLCSFLFPGVIKRGDLTIGISTGGTSPAYARELRMAIEKTLPPHIGGILERMGRLRAAVPKQVASQKDRKVCYEQILALLLETDNQASPEDVQRIIDRFVQSPGTDA